LIAYENDPVNKGGGTLREIPLKLSRLERGTQEGTGKRTVLHIDKNENMPQLSKEKK
jgi:hypothetical protein